MVLVEKVDLLLVQDIRPNMLISMIAMDFRVHKLKLALGPSDADKDFVEDNHVCMSMT